MIFESKEPEMKSKPTQWVAGSLAVAVMAVAVAVGQNAMQAEPTAVAVVNVRDVFNALQQKQDIEADLKQKFQQFEQKRQQRQQNIQQMRKNLNVLQPGTDNYKEQRQKIERAVVDFKAWQQYRQQKLERRRGVEMQNLYRKVAQTAGQVAKDNGYDIVLYDEGEADFNFQNSKQLSTMIRMRKVLWSSDKLNISDQVRTRMNNQYTSGS
jgi:Skp family chaperone for outer membrane proteins